MTTLPLLKKASHVYNHFRSASYRKAWPWCHISFYWVTYQPAEVTKQNRICCDLVHWDSSTSFLLFPYITMALLVLHLNAQKISQSSHPRKYWWGLYHVYQNVYVSFHLKFLATKKKMIRKLSLVQDSFFILLFD